MLCSASPPLLSFPAYRRGTWKMQRLQRNKTRNVESNSNIGHSGQHYQPFKIEVVFLLKSNLRIIDFIVGE